MSDDSEDPFYSKGPALLLVGLWILVWNGPTAFEQLWLGRYGTQLHGLITAVGVDAPDFPIRDRGQRSIEVGFSFGGRYRHVVINTYDRHPELLGEVSFIWSPQRSDWAILAKSEPGAGGRGHLVNAVVGLILFVPGLFRLGEGKWRVRFRYWPRRRRRDVPPLLSEPPQ